MNVLKYLAAILLIWGSSAIVVVNFKSVIPPLLNASLVIFIASAFYYIYFRIKSVDQIKELKKIDTSNLLKLSLLSFLGPFLYPIFYFMGLHSNRPFEANIINYSWPVVSIIASVIFQTEKITVTKVFAIAIGFLGVLMTTISVKFFSNYNTPRFDLDNIKSFAYAFFGAFSYGLYTALLKKLNIKNNTNANVTPETVFFGLLLFSAFFHLIIILIYTILGFNFNFYDVTPKAILFIFIYSIINFGLAYIIWIKILRIATISQTTLIAFLIPVVSTLLMYVFFQYKIELNVVLGLSAILLSLYILQNSNEYYTSPIFTFIIGFSIFSFIVLLYPPQSDFSTQDIIGFLQIFIGVFAIYSGLILNRVISKYNEENLLLFSLEESLLNIASQMHGNSIIKEKIDALMNEIIEINCKFESFDINTYKSIDVMRNDINNEYSLISDASNQEQYLKSFLQFDSSFIKWKYLKTESVSLYEWIILITISFIMIILCFIIKSSNLYYDLIKIGFGCAILQCLTAIRDFDLRRPNKKLFVTQITQRVSNYLQKQPYLPYSLIKKYNPVKNDNKILNNSNILLIRTTCDSEIQEMQFLKKSISSTLIIIIIILICVLEFIFLILRHA